VQTARAGHIRAHERRPIFIIVPADGTAAATAGNGDSGTSPFFGQLSDKLQLASMHLCGLSDAKHNSESQN